jgi:hypothetical protein
MAFWFVLVIPGFLFLWLITGSRDTLTQSMLALMGISAGTAVFSHANAAGKRNDSPLGKLQVREIELREKPSRDANEEEELKKCEERIKQLAPRTEGFLTDVLRDDAGISFHRFQMFIWTIVMGIIFVVAVYQSLEMPEFSGTLLGLMGISSGTYLGFMLTEDEKPLLKKDEKKDEKKDDQTGKDNKSG